MNTTELLLWTKIKDFQLDIAEAEFTFSHRVAQENGWSKTYAARVIEEYRRFIYLCCVNDKGITPSDPVDQVWHLHLTYTKSYWTDLCRNTLEKEIHHHPTKGGSAEALKFDEYYTRLQTVYTAHFGASPPPDIWHNNKTRFSDIDFQRVNLRKFWLIRKPLRKTIQMVTMILMCLVGVVSIQATGYVFPVVILGIVVAWLGFYAIRHRGKDDGKNSGCSAGAPVDSWGCSSDGHGPGDSGCSSGCSGSSGCSS